jgi:hypothetical protein
MLLLSALDVPSVQDTFVDTRTSILFLPSHLLLYLVDSLYKDRKHSWIYNVSFDVEIQISVGSVQCIFKSLNLESCDAIFLVCRCGSSSHCV